MTQVSVDSEILFESLCAHTSSLMIEHRVPGVSIGILHQGRVFTRGLGITNVDNPLLVNEETLFQIGSITKTFTGTLVMQLVEQGALALDASVRTYLPGFRIQDDAVSSNVNIRHLLTHSSNWVGDFFIDTGEGSDASAMYVERMAELPQLAPMGTTYSYNNAGFYLLGHVIETVTGRSYAALLREWILDPLGMGHCFLRAGEVMTHRFAVGHHLDRETDSVEVGRPWPLPRAVDAVGGLITTPAQLLKYARFQMGTGETDDGRRLLSASSMTLMQTPQVSVWGVNESVGLSWFINRRDGVTSISHTGGTVGQISLFSMVPEHNFAVAVLTNADAGRSIFPNVYRWSIEHFLGCEPSTPARQPASSDLLEHYAGYYVRPMSDLELTFDGELLRLQVLPKAGFPTAETLPAPAPPPATCALSEPDRLIVLDGPLKDSTIDFIRENSGEIGWARMGRIHRRQ
jgi:CubicO group peptidase (beta-lactamase class C family)